MTLIKAPENVCYDNGLLTWDASECADGYNVHLDSDYVATVTDTSFKTTEDGEWSVSAYIKAQSGSEAHTARTPMIRCISNSKPATGPIAGRSLVFDSNFENGVDPAQFQTELLWGDETTINQENALYVDEQNGNDAPFDNLPSPFSVGADGALNITASPLPANLQNVERNLTLQSGVILSPMNAFLYGYVEARIKVPCGGLGSWPAFWLLNRFYYDNAADKAAAEPDGAVHDKFNPEIDFEWVYGDGMNGPDSGPNAVKHALHYFTGDRNDENNYSLWTLDSGGFRQVDQNTFQALSQFNLSTGCSGEQIGNLPDSPGDFCSEYQVLGINWQPDRLEWLINGNVVRCVTDPTIIPDQLMYPIVNFTGGGTFPFGNPPQQTPPLDEFPQTLELDYLRIYQ